jgi:hypothetical protein
MGAKALPNLFNKNKRIARLVNGKPNTETEKQGNRGRNPHCFY